MNCSQYSYPESRQTQSERPMNMTQNGSYNLTTRPMQQGTNMRNARTGMGMPSAQGMTGSAMPNMNQTSPMLQGMGNAQAGQNGLTGAPVIMPESLGTQTPTTLESPYYTAGFLRNFIGKNMRVEFLIGTSGALVDRTGELVEVGASYIVLRPILSDDLLMADLYSIKFVTIYE